MTTEEFKKLKPEHANLEGDALWDAMTHYQLRQQQGEEILKTILPFWKRYRLRWLFYRKRNGFYFPKYSYERCENCKNGSAMGAIEMNFGTGECKKKCLNCMKTFIGEPNTNWNYRVYLFKKAITKFIEVALNWLHILRKRQETRYGMFGDEDKHVKAWIYNTEANTSETCFKKRKWWEYILIEK